MAWLIDVYRLKEIEDEAPTVEYPEKLTTIDRVRRTIENINAYLLQKSGVNGVLLALVTRLIAVPPPENMDLPFGMPSYNEKMIRRAPHTGLAFQSNNIMVWHLLRHIFHGGPGLSWIQAHAASMDPWMEEEHTIV
jgi:hypothetical protein